MKHRTLFLFLAAVSLLGPVQACSSASKAAEVTADQPAHADYSAPEGAIMARDAALTYVEHSMDVSGLTSISDWRGQDVTPTNLVGQTTIEFTSGDWQVTIAFPVVAPEHVSYTAEVVNQTLGIDWMGTVDRQGQVTPIAAPEPVSESTPEEPQLPVEGGIQVVGWFGHIESLPAGAQWDDKLVLGNSAGVIGVEGATDDLKDQIVALRDHAEPGKYAHFWGTLHCDVPDVGGCQLLVTRLRRGTTWTDDDTVEAWEGTLVSNPPGS